MSQVNIKKPRSPLVPVMVAGTLAVVGIAGFMFLFSTPRGIVNSNGESMISAAAVSRAGATEAPSVPGAAAPD